ncbi:MAG: restriction endonuclease subunit S [Bacteroidia bacterium]|nr:restriction endonuclease subunit S [Bacteroidia bacterium]
MSKSIKFKDIINNSYILSARQYQNIYLKNEKFLLIKNFLNRELNPSDKGIEIGSINYISKSTHFFIRNKSLQKNSFIPSFSSDSLVSMMPSSFVNYNLKEGDILISKDSNIGETVILDKDYSNYMFSGGIYRLPITDNKYYLLAFLKHFFFKKQLEVKVPDGVTIKHAKTLFLDCKIPLPGNNKDEVIKYIEILTCSIINKEKEIRNKHIKINDEDVEIDFSFLQS